MTLNCIKCGEIKALMHPIKAIKNGNITGMMCPDCKNKEIHEHVYDEDVHFGDDLIGMACACGNVKDNEPDHDLKAKA